MNDNIDREKMYEILERMGMPFVRIEIHNDKMERKESPIGAIADVFEILVNSLMGDVIIAGSEEAGNFLNHLETQLRSLSYLASNILNDRERLERISEKLEVLRKEAKEEGREEEFYESIRKEQGSKEGEEEVKTPISNVWKEAWEDAQGSLYFLGSMVMTAGMFGVFGIAQADKILDKLFICARHFQISLIVCYQ